MKTEAKHAPGLEWTAQKYTSYHAEFWAIVDHDENTIAKEICTKTTANILASAPAMLAALELAEATIERLTVRHGPFSSTAGTQSVIREAIRNAKGEE